MGDGAWARQYVLIVLTHAITFAPESFLCFLFLPPMQEADYLGYCSGYILGHGGSPFIGIFIKLPYHSCYDWSLQASNNKLRLL